MLNNEATARIKINKLLEEAGWKFFDDENGKANISLENNVKITQEFVNDLDKSLKKSKNGKIDFLLLDKKSFPVIVLEAKAIDKNPLIGKEQAREYAKSLNVRFIILSNGNLHYYWDLEKGNPHIITKYPSPDEITISKSFIPNTKDLINEIIERDYIVLTQKPDYKKTVEYKISSSLNDFIDNQQNFITNNKLKFLRPYQVDAIKSIQNSISEGKDRFLFEMATGTGKTLTSSAVIKLFLRSGNARRVLFLVDRLELEDQADKAFKEYLKNDYKSVIFKENRDDWQKAEIVVTTIQTLLFNNKYRNFSPSDFDLIISDEAHRSIGGNSRAVFEYFGAYKLGLTATPKEYLKNIDTKMISQKDPKIYERRLLLDTYETFGCKNGKPTFRYTLLDGVKEGFLINPIIIDVRTEVTTKLLSDEGYSVVGLIHELTQQQQELTQRELTQQFKQRDFEKKFFSEDTNNIFCKTFMENALRDPLSGEIGKTIVFCVSQNHALKITEVLNDYADKMFPEKYNSDFAVQITSLIKDSQQFTINFANNNLNGHTKFLDGYKSSKTRVAVTVGMMTTGYDCQDILNICMMRPIFSPTDFIQIKGRGTRKYTFTFKNKNESNEDEVFKKQKDKFKLFDFFANCEYFEEKFNYDETLKLPAKSSGLTLYETQEKYNIDQFENFDPDKIINFQETQVGLQGMKIDRMYFEKFEEEIKKDQIINKDIENGNWENAITYINEKFLSKDYSIENLRKAIQLDRKLTIKEIIEKVYGIIPYFKSKDELLSEEFEKFLSIYKPEFENLNLLKYFFKAYITDKEIREILKNKEFNKLSTNPKLNISDFKQLNDWKNIIPEYINDYVEIDNFKLLN